MWLVLNDSFVSVVQHNGDSNLLVVRGRHRGDVARFLGLPARLEVETPSADYRFRITARRETVERAAVRAIGKVRYPNFKNSIVDQWRKTIAMRIWWLFYRHQEDTYRPGSNSLPLFDDEIGGLRG